MNTLREDFIVRLRPSSRGVEPTLLVRARSLPRITMTLSAVIHPPPPRLRLPPKWDSLQIASIMLVPVHTARIMLWQFCASTFETFFLGPNKIRYPFDFCGKNTFLYDILQVCNRPDIIDHASRIDIAQPHEDTDLCSLFYVVNISMDDLLASWRLVPATNSSPDPAWIRYLEIVESFGPFGAESWMTVHVSLMWLLDWFFLSPQILSYSTNKFCRKWRRMVRMRRDLNVSIAQRIQFSFPPCPPPMSGAVTLPLSETMPLITQSPVEIISPPLCGPNDINVFNTPTPSEDRGVTPTTSLVMPHPSRHKRHKKRKRKRRMDFYKKYFRPSPPPPQILQLPLAVTSMLDIHRSRSAGSFNVKDPPGTKCRDAYLPSR